MKKLLSVFDIKFLKFILVGIGNTLFSAAIMFLLYDLGHLGYWGSSAVSYVLGSILSFILNRKYTFQNQDSVFTTFIKFAINVSICYLIAYSMAKPLTILALSKFLQNEDLIIKISMLVGMCLFTFLNYFGQRFFAFKEK